MICVIDNYDSFVYNLVQYAGMLEHECVVLRHDSATVAQVAELRPDLVIISPGPGAPEEAGISLPLITELAGQVPIFGVCLGHQCIGQAFGADVVHAREPMHGKLSPVRHRGEGIFAGLPDPLEVARYHSLVVDPRTLPDELVVTAWTEEGEIMGLRHRSLPIEGVQFHPESLFTDQGLRLVENALTAARTMAAMPA